MGKKSPATVQAPDPRNVARDDAMYNRINQITPYGNLMFSGPYNNTATIELSPDMQQLVDTRLQSDLGIMGSAMQRMGMMDPNQIDLTQFGPIQSNAGLSQFDPSSMNLPAIPTDMEAFRNRAEDAVFNRGSRMLNPYFEQQERSMLDRLANQGLPQGSAAYGQELDVFGDNRNQAYADLADRAVMTGGQEAANLLAQALGARSQMFGEGMQTTNFNNLTSQQGLTNQNAGRMQAMNEALGIRGNAFNELASLMGLQQVSAPTMQNFFAPGMVDVIGANQLGLQGQMFNAQQQNQMNQAALSGLYGMGSAALGGGIPLFGQGGLFGGGG